METLTDSEVAALLPWPALRDAAEITVFKSVGIALEDLAAARLAFPTGPVD